MTETCRWCGSRRAFVTTIGRQWYDCGSWDHDGGEAWQNKDCRIAEVERAVERLTKERDEAREAAHWWYRREMTGRDPSVLTDQLELWPWLEKKHENA